MLKDLHMNTNEKPPATYASIAQVAIFLYPCTTSQALKLIYLTKNYIWGCTEDLIDFFFSFSKRNPLTMEVISFLKSCIPYTILSN